MQLIRGSLLHKFLTEGLFSKSDERFQGISVCSFILEIIDKLSGLGSVAASFTFVVIGFLLEVFGNLPADASDLPFILYISLVFFWLGTTLTVLMALVFCIIYLKDSKILPKIKNFPKPFKKIDCGVVQVLDKRIER